MSKFYLVLCGLAASMLTLVGLSTSASAQDAEPFTVRPLGFDPSSNMWWLSIDVRGEEGSLITADLEGCGSAPLGRAKTTTSSLWLGVPAGVMDATAWVSITVEDPVTGERTFQARGLLPDEISSLRTAMGNAFGCQKAKTRATPVALVKKWSVKRKLGKRHYRLTPTVAQPGAKIAYRWTLNGRKMGSKTRFFRAPKAGVVRAKVTVKHGAKTKVKTLRFR